MEHTHIFITGCTNSGTGFLRFLISKHPELSVLMEEGQVYCKMLPHDHKFKHVKNRLFSLYPEIYRFPKDKAKEEIGRKMKEDFYKHWDLSKKFLVEKSPHHMIRMEFTQEVFPSCKFIGIVRDGFAVCEGIRRKRSHHIRLCAKHWNLANKIMLKESGYMDFHLVKYEDLCKEPQKTMNKIFDFIEVRSITVDMDMAIPRANLFGKKKYFTLKDSPDFDKESWRLLSKRDRDIIRKEAKEMLDYYGYLEYSKWEFLE